MNWEAIGAIGELVGALGVILSLVYLALQIRQNSRMLEQNTSVSHANSAVISSNHGSEFVRAIALDEDASAIWQRGQSDSSSLSPPELARFDQLMVAQIIQMDANFYLLRKGTLDPDVHGIWERMLDRWFAHPRFRRFFDSGGVDSLCTDAFSAYVKARADELTRLQP